MKTRGERRRITKNIIKKRKRKLLGILIPKDWISRGRDPFENGELYENELKNNNMMNAYGGGCYRKTKTRKASATYRHHVAYGPAKRYTKHDRLQIEKLESQLKELSSIEE